MLIIEPLGVAFLGLAQSSHEEPDLLTSPGFDLADRMFFHTEKCAYLSGQPVSE